MPSATDNDFKERVDQARAHYDRCLAQIAQGSHRSMNEAAALAALAEYIRLLQSYMEQLIHKP